MVNKDRTSNVHKTPPCVLTDFSSVDRVNITEQSSTLHDQMSLSFLNTLVRWQ